VHSRRIRALGAALLAGALTLTACGTSEKPKSGPLDKITVTGGSDKEAPTITVEPKPLSVTDTTTKVVKAGDGATVKGDEIVSIKYVLLNAKDATVLDTNFGKQNLGLSLDSANLLPGLKKGLTNQKIGSRVLVAMPPKDAFGTQGNADLKVGATDTVLFLMDLVSATKALPEAQGKQVAPAKGLPTVVYNSGKAATITIPKGAKPPTKLVNQTLVEGTGATIKAGMTVRATYTGVLWRDGSMFDNSWAHDPAYFEFPAGGEGAIKAWSDGVVGKKVGSRLLLVVPPAYGYGAAGQPPKIKGTDTLVFVVDLLAAY
jgi:peptidylprolyl isomerase